MFVRSFPGSIPAASSNHVAGRKGEQAGNRLAVDGRGQPDGRLPTRISHNVEKEENYRKCSEQKEKSKQRPARSAHSLYVQSQQLGSGWILTYPPSSFPF